MHIGKSYALTEFVRWTRRKSYILIAVATTQVAAYQLLGWHWLAMPWAVAALLGTAASFIVGFKNAQTYNRTTEAQQIWSSIASKALAGLAACATLADCCSSRYGCSAVSSATACSATL